MKAKGAYQVPTSDSMLYSFMIYKNIRWVNTTRSSKKNVSSQKRLAAMVAKEQVKLKTSN